MSSLSSHCSSTASRRSHKLSLEGVRFRGWRKRSRAEFTLVRLFTLFPLFSSHKGEVVAVEEALKKARASKPRVETENSCSNS